MILTTIKAMESLSPVEGQHYSFFKNVYFILSKTISTKQTNNQFELKGLRYPPKHDMSWFGWAIFHTFQWISHSMNLDQIMVCCIETVLQNKFLYLKETLI
jgi:hypothetical protein